MQQSFFAVADAADAGGGAGGGATAAVARETGAGTSCRHPIGVIGALDGISSVSGTGRSPKRMGDCTSSREKAFQRTKVGDTVLSSRTVHFAAVPTVDVMASKPAPACRVAIGRRR